MVHAKIEVHFKVKQIMKISELAERAGIATSAIRYYERAQLLPKPVRGANGYRELESTAGPLMGAAAQQTEVLSQVYTTYNTGTPRVRADVDRDRAQLLGRIAALLEVLPEQPSAEPRSVLEPNAATAVEPGRLAQQLPIGSIMKKDALGVGEHELHLAQGIVRSRKLPDPHFDLPIRDGLPVHRARVDDRGVVAPV